MFQNYLKIALRNLWKNRIFTVVNGVGIACSIAAFIFILQYISFERSVNQFHTNLPNLYRVLFLQADGKNWADFAQPALATLLKNNFSEVKDACRIIADGTASGTVTYVGNQPGDQVRSFRQADIIYADASFFNLFTFQVLNGEANLQQPNTVVITKTQAEKYFGNTNPIGKNITLFNQFGNTLYTVTGVVENVPESSDLQFDMVFSLETLKNLANLNGNDWANLDSWDASFTRTFLLLKNKADYHALEQKIDAYKKQIFPESKESVHLQPLQNLHLASSLSDTQPTTGNVQFVYLIGSIGLLILIIAWLNYVNLATAGSLKRAKEVGIRKIVGANRKQLIGQFLGESLLLNLFGFIAALIIIKLLQPSFNHLVEKDLSLDSILQNNSWSLGLALVLLGLVFSGSYVSYVLSSFSTSDTLKGTFSRSLKGITLRKGLVIFQFTISSVLIIGTLVLYRQLQFMQNQNLGMNVNQVLVIQGPEVDRDSTFRQRNSAFMNELKRLSFVQGLANTDAIPGMDYNYNATGITRLNPQPEDEKKAYAMALIDENYLHLFDIHLLAGQNFTFEICERKYADNDKILLNERAALQLGFDKPEDAVGQKIQYGKQFEVLGVVKDYHHFGLHQAIDPILFFPRHNADDYAIRLTTNQMQSKMQTLQKLYRQSFPNNPFDYYFADENYNKQYHAEQRYSIIFLIASGLAILISCLGLFGLATFSVEQKTKEIGIRKVLGASVENIVTLVSKDFLMLVGIAFLIATPIAWWAANKWLQDFAYRADLSWWIFGIAGALAGSIAIITVSFQAIRAAVANPVKSLRSE